MSELGLQMPPEIGSVLVSKTIQVISTGITSGAFIQVVQTGRLLTVAFDSWAILFRRNKLLRLKTFLNNLRHELAAKLPKRTSSK